MRTLIKKLKLGAVLTGFLFLSSCGSGSIGASEVGMMAINRTIPSLVITATKYTGNKISEYLNNSSAAKNENKESVKKSRKVVRNRMVLPITLGFTEARLVSSTSR